MFWAKIKLACAPSLVLPILNILFTVKAGGMRITQHKPPQEKSEPPKEKPEQEDEEEEEILEPR